MTFGSSKESKNILSRYTNTKWIYVRVDKQIRPDKSIKYRSIPCSSTTYHHDVFQANSRPIQPSRVHNRSLLTIDRKVNGE
ncbi:hypothetical protein BLOT_015265 [Blomia tropicalis]|nr:hypothetical protein BLOT_015265 [Blomia tropicalis]